MRTTKYADCKIIEQVLRAKDALWNRLIDINAKSINKNTAISIAVELEDVKKRKVLLKNGADIELAKEKISREIKKKARKSSSKFSFIGSKLYP